MKTFDFLPQRYRDLSTARKVQWWRLAVVMMFGGVIAATAIAQHTWHSAVQREWITVTSQHAQTEELRSQLANAVNKLQEDQAQADLFAYLHHPWPRTQIISAVTSSLSPPIKLTQVRIGREGGSEGSGSRAAPAVQLPPLPVAAGEGQAVVAASALPAERDLKRLHDELDGRRLVVEISGLAGDLPLLHEYLAQLAAKRLFEKAELVSVEQESKSADGSAQFRLRLLVRNGYGQFGGPAVPVATEGNSSLKPGPG